MKQLEFSKKITKEVSLTSEWLSIPDTVSNVLLLFILTFLIVRYKGFEFLLNANIQDSKPR